jgi:hypothetical protein
MNLIFVFLGMILLAACDSGQSDVRSASGKTPIRYVICGIGETNCFVAARFKDLDACESHKKWSDMLCDSKSTPGEMHCRTDTGPTVATSYCTQ